MKGLCPTTIKLIREHQVEIKTDSVNGFHAGHILVKPEGEPARPIVSTGYIYVSRDFALGSLEFLVATLRRTA